VELIELLDTLAQRGVQLSADGERLRCRAPQGALTPEIRAALEAHKPAILASLRTSGQGAALPPLVRVDRASRLPLSFAQQRLWFLAELEPESAAYNIPAAVEMSGPLDVAALRRAAEAIVQRHEVLRTTFANERGEPVPVIHPSMPVDLVRIDLRGLDPVRQQDRLRFQMSEQTRRPIDIVEGPLLRLALVQMSEEAHVLLFTIHHIASDGWSSRVFLHELARLYEAFTAGRPSPLAELTIQYVDFARWQRAWLSGDVLERQLAYWRRQLSGLAPLDLPFDRPRGPVQTFAGRSVSFTLPADLSADLKATSRELGVTLFMLLLAAFKSLVYLYTDQRDIAVGSPSLNRVRPEVEPLIGFFVNTVVLRTRLEGTMTFRELVARVRETTLEAFAHQDVPFEQLVAEIQPRRDLSRHALFQVVFVLQDNPVERQEIAGLTLRQLEVESTHVKFDLVVNVWPAQDALVVWWEYNSDLFEASTIGQMSADFEALLRDIVRHSDSRLDDLTILTPHERAALAADVRVRELDRDFAL
jgi:aspartate racemase